MLVILVVHCYNSICTAWLIAVGEHVEINAFVIFRLLNAFAEEAALEDAIYYMGEALRCGVIDLDVFLRQVRTLSRKQFMLRALMQSAVKKPVYPYRCLFLPDLFLF
nr:unnamed protein product [Callosobruchus chinensis]